jgi:mRNA-degrading endonuclease RelE of RelBE toxin-antitoxin system
MLRKRERQQILEEVENQLKYQPVSVTRNRKKLRPNRMAEWELRISRFRVFYDVDEIALQVKIEAVGYKKGNKLLIHGQEYQL